MFQILLLRFFVLDIRQPLDKNRKTSERVEYPESNFWGQTLSFYTLQGLQSENFNTSFLVCTQDVAKGLFHGHTTSA